MVNQQEFLEKSDFTSLNLSKPSLLRENIKDRRRKRLEISYSQPKQQYFFPYSLWQYRFWSFQAGDTKLERFLHKQGCDQW